MTEQKEKTQAIKLSAWQEIQLKNITEQKQRILENENLFLSAVVSAQVDPARVQGFEFKKAEDGGLEIVVKLKD